MATAHGLGRLAAARSETDEAERRTGNSRRAVPDSREVLPGRGGRCPAAAGLPPLHGQLHRATPSTAQTRPPLPPWSPRRRSPPAQRRRLRGTGAQQHRASPRCRRRCTHSPSLRASPSTCGSGAWRERAEVLRRTGEAQACSSRLLNPSHRWEGAMAHSASIWAMRKQQDSILRRRRKRALCPGACRSGARCKYFRSESPQITLPSTDIIVHHRRSIGPVHHHWSVNLRSGAAGPRSVYGGI